MKPNLFDIFSSETPKWETLVDKELKKADAASGLIWKTYEGFDVYPYQENYSTEKVRELAWAISQLCSTQAKFEFYNLQQLEVTDPLALCKKIIKALNGGVNALRIKGNLSEADFKTAFNGVFTEVLWLEWLTDNPVEAARIVVQFLTSRNISPLHQSGSINFSPLQQITEGKLSSDALNPDDLKDYLNKMSSLLPNVKALKVDAGWVANAGGNMTQQIAFALSQGNEYLNLANENDLSIQQIADQLHFNFAIGSNFLIECVKIRVFRFLWMKILNQYGLNNHSTFVSSETATFGYSIYDSHNNLLRATTASMSAILSGSDAHLVLPFDNEYKEATDFSDRIARNITNILLEESFLKKAENPTQGSYVFDNIQYQLCEKAWELFLNWETEGGFLKAQNQLKDTIKKSAEIVLNDFENGRQIILGVNKYPNKSEKKQLEIEKKLPTRSKEISPFRLSEKSELNRLNEEGVEVK